MKTATRKPVAKTTKQTKTQQLKQMAKDINAQFGQLKNVESNALVESVKLGKLMIQAKEAHGHEKFMDWVTANCKFSHRSATDYMTLANPENAAIIKDAQSIRDALNKIREGHTGERKERKIPKHLAELEAFIPKVQERFKAKRIGVNTVNWFRACIDLGFTVEEVKAKLVAIYPPEPAAEKVA